MRPETIGRALGIGARLAGKKLMESANAAGAPKAAPAPTPRSVATPASHAAAKPSILPPQPARRGPTTAHYAKSLGKGSKHLGRSVWGPFAHATGTLWYEITGMFFALFALFFGQHAWSLRNDRFHGPEHVHFLIYVALSVAFGYFCFSSFFRSRSRGRRRA